MVRKKECRCLIWTSVLLTDRPIFKADDLSPPWDLCLQTGISTVHRYLFPEERPSFKRRIVKDRIMERMLHYIEHYRALPQEAKDFFVRYGRRTAYPAKEYYKLPDEAVRKWCFVLQGAVAMEQVPLQGPRRIKWVCTANSYFCGTKNPFSTQADPLAMRFLVPTVLYEIDNRYFTEALLQFPAVDTAFSILRQQQLDRLKLQLHILDAPVIERLHLLYVHLPELPDILTVADRCALLRIANHRDYYRAQDYHRKKR